MDRGYKWRVGIVLATVLFGLVYVVPNFVPEGSLPDWFPNNKFTLGLDLQGGLLLQYSVDVEKAVSDKVDRTVPEVKSRLEAKKAGVAVTLTREGLSGILIAFANAADAGLVDEKFLWDFPTMEKIDRGPGTILLRMPDEAITRLREGAVDKSIETIRSRIDAFGRNPARSGRGAAR